MVVIARARCKNIGAILKTRFFHKSISRKRHKIDQFLKILTRKSYQKYSKTPSKRDDSIVEVVWRSARNNYLQDGHMWLVVISVKYVNRGIRSKEVKNYVLLLF